MIAGFHALVQTESALSRLMRRQSETRCKYDHESQCTACRDARSDLRDMAARRFCPTNVQRNVKKKRKKVARGRERGWDAGTFKHSFALEVCLSVFLSPSLPPSLPPSLSLSLSLSHTHTHTHTHTQREGGMKSDRYFEVGMVENVLLLKEM